MYMLTGFNHGEYLEQYFTDTEVDLAVHVALRWDRARYRPRLYYKTWNRIALVKLSDVINKAA